MRHESGATVSDFGTSMPPDDGGAHDVRVEVSRNRDAEFTAFVRESGAYLQRTAYLLCGDRHRAEELVQSTFERVYRTWAKVQPGTQRAYARQILVNLRIDGWRHGRRELFPGDDNLPIGATPDHAGRLVLRDELVRGLAQLPANQRKVVVLRHLLDLPEADVARELGIAVGTVKAANSRGLARLRDMLRASAAAVEPPELDESVVLDRSRAALRRRRTGQAVGAACVTLLLALGFLTRGPVELPWVGRVVLPGGQLITSLFDVGPTDGLGPDLGPGNTPLECPGQLPGPTTTRAAEPGDDIGPLDDPVMVDATDTRVLTCHDVNVEAVTGGSLDSALQPVTDRGEPLPEPEGISDTGKIWHFSEELPDDDDGTDAAYIRTSTWTGEGASYASSLTRYQGRSTLPTRLAVTGDRVVWSERAAEDTSPRRSFLRTLNVSGDGVTTLIDPLASTEERLWLLATTEDRALWTAGVTDDDTRLFAVAHDGDGTPTELAAGVTALAADDDEAVAAVLVPGNGPIRVTTIRLFDDLAGGGDFGTDLFEIEHDSSAEVTQIAISDDVIAWTVVPVGGGSGALYVHDRLGDGDSVVRLPDGIVTDLRASGSLVSWTSSTDTTAENPADASYLYRATASASGYDGPDLARFPGGSVTASLAGDRTAWLEVAAPRRWLVEGAIVPVLERG